MKLNWLRDQQAPHTCVTIFVPFSGALSYVVYIYENHCLYVVLFVTTIPCLHVHHHKVKVNSGNLIQYIP